MRAGAYVDEDVIASAVEQVAKALTPDVVRIRFRLGTDWAGDGAIFFRVLLSDEASREARLRDTVRSVEDAVLGAVRPGELDLLAYFNYRSLSEQRELREESWA